MISLNKLHFEPANKFEYLSEVARSGRIANATKQCVFCSRNYTMPTVRIIDAQRYLDGMHAQHAFPYLSETQRDHLILGWCTHCIDDFYSYDENDEPVSRYSDVSVHEGEPPF